MIKIGLTGNIASGKSAIEDILKKSGFLVFDLDKICADLYLNDENIKKQILNEFKTLNKKEIAHIVFSDSAKKKTLESIIHPKLKEIISELFKKNAEKIVISGALIYEAEFDKFFDKIIFVDAPYEIRLERLQKRNNLNKIEAKKRMDSQNTSNKSKADCIIENTGTLKELENKVKEALKLL